MTIVRIRRLFRMNHQLTKLFSGIVFLVSAVLIFGDGRASAQNGIASDSLDLGFTVGDGSSETISSFDADRSNVDFLAANPRTDVFHSSGQTPVASSSAPVMFPDSSSPWNSGNVSPSPGGVQNAGLQNVPGKRTPSESLNRYFDSFETDSSAGPADLTAYNNGYAGSIGLMSVRDGLIPASNKSVGRLFVDGWVSGSVFNKNQWPVTNGFDENTEGLNSAGSESQLNQAYVTFGREIDYADHWDVGGRIDLLYGTDYILASSLGLESFNHAASGAAAGNIFAAEPRWNRNSRGGYPAYGLAMPQAYAEAYAPLLAGLSVKMGHFYSPMGYESICSPSNFFYSHSYTMLYGQPQTLTGLTAKQRLGDQFSLIAGAHQGWNVWDDNNDKWDVMGGLTWENGPNTTLSFLVMTGEAVIDNDFNRPTREFSPVNGRQTNYSLVFQRKISHELTWALEHDLGIAEDAAFSFDSNFNQIREDGYWYSIVNYLYFSITPQLDFGARAEWFCDQNRTRLLGGMPTQVDLPAGGYKWTGDNLFDISLGMNWRPTRYVTIRPEVRWDYSDIQMTNLNGDRILRKGIYDNFSDDNLLTFGGDIIVHF